MKIKVFIMLIFAMFVFGLTLQYKITELETLYTELDTTATYDWNTAIDSMVSNLDDAHYARAAIHVKSDATTARATATACDTPAETATYLNNQRTALLSHMAKDSVHVGPCTTTTVPAAIGLDATLAQIETYKDTLNLAIDAHYAHTYNTRYEYLLKALDAAMVAHDAKDTTDAADVHFSATTVYITAKADTTNEDSTRASLIRMSDKWDKHVKSLVKHNANSYDTIPTILKTPTTLYGDQLLANALLSAYNSHAAKDKSLNAHKSLVGAVHHTADTGLIENAAVVHGGHLVADTAGSSKAEPFTAFLMPYYEENTIAFTGSSVTDGATFYIYGSVDGVNYNKADTLNVDADGTVLKPLSTWYPYLKITCASYTDGAFTVKMRGGR
jgi:hypothetical protein